MSARRVAIVGAGLTGLACAQALRTGGTTVTVFERARAGGGRLATRRTDRGGFDHGAQYFTVRDPAFAGVVARWEDRGLAARWQPRLGRSEGGRPQPSPDPQPRWVGVPGMSALPRALLDGLALRTETEVVSLARVGESWTLRDATGHTHGPFDAVGVTVAALQAAPLLAAHADFARQARNAAYTPCFALMAAFDAPLALPYDGVFVRDGALAWIARDSSKPGRAAGERWVAHASPDWAEAHLETPAETLAPCLLAELATLTGDARPPEWTSCHRWRYALPRAPLGTACLWDAASGLGAAGDWCADGRVEGAYRSGEALAAAMLRPSSP